MKPDDRLSKKEQLERAISAQESLRGTLDDAIIDATIDALRKQLAELDQRTVLEQQRKLATVLFLDIVSSTRLMRELDPEDHMVIMDAVLQKLAVPVDLHGGRVITFMGDGYLAVFGLPRAREMTQKWPYGRGSRSWKQPNPSLKRWKRSGVSKNSKCG
jgi:class 3 adenylate cyclase